jgi:TetR/AcrR family transcriptional regulator, transcriptional repressor for nem operon
MAREWQKNCTCGKVNSAKPGGKTMAEPDRKKGPGTRERLMDAAERSILDKGFATTSIEELIAEVGITKSGFFYHFPDKGTLAKALLERYLEREESMFDDMFARARELDEDPLHAFLIGLKLMAEMMTDLPESHPGCLVASYCYQENMFNRDVRDLNRQGVLRWRLRFRGHLEDIAEIYPPRVDVNLDHLADMFSALADGGIILSKVIRDKGILPQQLMLYREFVRSVFLGIDRN